MKRTFFAALAASCLSTPAMAVTLTEGIDYADAPVADLGLFGPGTTTVEGTLTGNCVAVALPVPCNLLPGDPSDRITFGLMPGLTMTGLQIALAPVLDPGSLSGEISVATPGGPATFSNLFPGIYAIDPAGLSGTPYDVTISADQAAGVGAFELNWSVTATVTTVPLPGAAGLLLVALTATGLAARRRMRGPT
jgi:hypothetical protein